MAKPRKLSVWTVDEATLRHIVDTSETQSEAIERCGSKPKGTAPFRAFQARCLEFGIDLEPLRKKSRSKVGRDLRSRQASSVTPLGEILVEHSKYGRYHLKKRLVGEGVLVDQCSRCGLSPEWLGQRLVMVLDHINGIADDHRLENLRLLCPNCNSQTPTFCKKQPTASDDESGTEHRRRWYCSCGEEIGRRTKTGLCPTCSCRERRKVERPSADELSELLSTTSMLKIGLRYGVSDNAVRKWAKSYGLL